MSAFFDRSLEVVKQCMVLLVPQVTEGSLNWSRCLTTAVALGAVQMLGMVRGGVHPHCWPIQSSACSRLKGGLVGSGEGKVQLSAKWWVVLLFWAHRRADRGHLNPPVSRGLEEHRCAGAARRARDPWRYRGPSPPAHFRAHHEADGRSVRAGGLVGDLGGDREDVALPQSVETHAVDSACVVPQIMEATLKSCRSRHRSSCSARCHKCCKRLERRRV